MKSKLIKILIGILIAVIVFCVLFLLVPSILNRRMTLGDDDERLDGLDLSGLEVLQDETYKNTPSDIDGWTVYDKVSRGLIPDDGADSDSDGLTDKEEIEVYGSDPLKTSTAGDLYTDGYKIENNMDVNAYYEQSGEIEYKYNECPEVRLYADDASGIFANVQDDGISRKIDGFEIYKTYFITHFNGNIEVEVSGIISEKEGVSIDNLDILIGKWSSYCELEKVDINRDDDIIAPTFHFEGDNSYYMCVAKATSIFSPKHSTLDLSLNSREKAGDISDADYLFLSILPITSLATPSRLPHMYYVPTGDEEIDNAIVTYLIDLCYDALDGYVPTITAEDVKPISKAKMATLKTFLKPIASGYSFESMQDLIMDSDTFRWSYLLCMYNDKYVSDYEHQTAKVSRIVTYSTGDFDVSYDALPFGNFGTEHAKAGNCAGIAYLTAALYNDKEFKSCGEYSSGRYESGVGTLTWDLGKDEENKTLLDPGLIDYKTSSFKKDHKGEDGYLINLNDGEEEFTKMISAYWAKINDCMLVPGAKKQISNYGSYSWEMIEEMKAYFNKDKILIIGLMDCDGFGHAVNIIGYTEEADTVIFYLYDNMFPRNHRGGNTLIPCPTLIVRKIHCESGYAESFDYCYTPYEGCGYEYSSKNNVKGQKVFIVMDSDFNVFNQKY